MTAHRVIALGLLAGGSLAAHDLYLLPERFHVKGGEVLTVALHNGDAFPESEANAPIERLRDSLIRGAQGTADIKNLHDVGKETLGTVTVPGSGTLVLTTRSVPHFISMQPAEFSAYLKEEGLSHVIAFREKSGDDGKPSRERYSKFAKSLLVAGESSDEYRKPTGLVIEIVPEKDPYRLHPGGTLPVQVLFRGKPEAGIQLEAAWSGPSGNKVQIIGITDSRGHIDVPLSAAGKWRLHSLKMERCAEPAAADWESYWASLTFELR